MTTEQLDDPRLGIGGNNPPEPTPLEQAREDISILDEEARHWLDGKPIENQAQADDVAKLIDAARKAKSRFDADRKAEKAPHDAAAKAVDAAWKPVIEDADRIVKVGKAVQTDWLIKQDEAKRETERLMREEAERKAEEARKLAEEADGSLEAAKVRDLAVADAENAQKAAALAASDKAGAKAAGMGRAMSLRSTWRAMVEDRRALLNHVAVHDPDALTAFLEEWAGKAVRHGARDLPGVSVYEERVAA